MQLFQRGGTDLEQVRNLHGESAAKQASESGIAYGLWL